jgi:hypothetical protein
LSFFVPLSLLLPIPPPVDPELSLSLDVPRELSPAFSVEPCPDADFFALVEVDDSLEFSFLESRFASDSSEELVVLLFPRSPDPDVSSMELVSVELVDVIRFKY